MTQPKKDETEERTDQEQAKDKRRPVLKAFLTKRRRDREDDH